MEIIDMKLIELIGLIVSFIASGLPGIITYTILVKSRVLNFGNNQEIEKKSIITGVSLLHVVLIFLTGFIFKDKFLLGYHLFWEIPTIVIASVVIAYVIVWLSVEVVYIVSNLILGNNKATLKADSVYDVAFDTKEATLYIFDFQGNSIHQGALFKMTDNIDDGRLEILFESSEIHEYGKELELKKDLKSSEDHYKKHNIEHAVYIDFDRKIKVYVRKQLRKAKKQTTHE